MKATSHKVHISDTCSCGNHSTTTNVWAIDAGLFWYNCDDHSTHVIDMKDVSKKVIGLHDMGEDTARIKIDKKYWDDFADK